MASPKPRVLLISASYPPDGGGVATHVQSLAHGLYHAGCSVFVATAARGRDQFRRTRPEETLPEFRVWKRLGRRGRFSAEGAVPLNQAIKRLLDNWHLIRPDVIHAHDLQAAHIGAMIKAVFKCPLVLSVHQAPQDWQESLPRRDSRFSYLRALREFQIVDRLVAPSSAYRDTLIKQGFPTRRIQLVPHGINWTHFASIADNPAVLAKFRLKKTDRLILCPARADPKKDLETFIRCACILRSNKYGKRRHLFVIAYPDEWEPSSYLKEVFAIARSKRLPPKALRVALCTYREMPTLYRRAEVCVLPSVREGFGLVILEAFALGVPVVAAGTGGIPDIIQHDATGLLATVRDAGDFAHQINRILTDANLRVNLAQAAHDALRTNYTVHRMVQGHLDLYSKALAAGT